MFPLPEIIALIITPWFPEREQLKLTGIYTSKERRLPWVISKADNAKKSCQKNFSVSSYGSSD